MTGIAAAQLIDDVLVARAARDLRRAVEVRSVSAVLSANTTIKARSTARGAPDGGFALAASD